MMRIVQNGPIREAMALVRAGVPFDTAFDLDDDWRRGLCIIAGELEGGKFNWHTMAFEEPKEG